MKAVEVVERLQQRPYLGGEFQTHETTARLQNTPRLGECDLDAGHVAQPKRDRVEIEAALGEGQPLGVCAKPLDAVEYALVERAGASDLEHALVGIADAADRAAFDYRALWNEVRQCPQCDVAGAAGYVDQQLARAR